MGRSRLTPLLPGASCPSLSPLGSRGPPVPPHFPPVPPPSGWPLCAAAPRDLPLLPRAQFLFPTGTFWFFPPFPSPFLISLTIISSLSTHLLILAASSFLSAAFGADPAPLPLQQPPHSPATPFPCPSVPSILSTPQLCPGERWVLSAGCGWPGGARPRCPRARFPARPPAGRGGSI